MATTDYEVQILMVLRKLARLVPKFAPDFDDQVTAEAWTDELVNLPPESLVRAAKAATERCREFPSIAELRSFAKPALSQKSASVEIASRIATAMERFGMPNGTAARNFIGELGWQVVELNGGWDAVCRSVESTRELAIHKAQWRECAQALHEKAALGITGAPALPASERQRGLESSATIINSFLLPAAN